MACDVLKNSFFLFFFSFLASLCRQEGAREVVAKGLASPVDGRVMTCGPVDAVSGKLQSVKDFTYSLEDFVGKPLSLPSAPKRPLYQIVLYLAPGDYHGFHAPAAMKLSERRHFAGYLLPVAPWMVERVPSLFAINERVVLIGDYDDGVNRGKMVYAPVGATNVGSIDLSGFDAEVVTNNRNDVIGASRQSKAYSPVVSLKRGENVGFFRMGSTVVLIFEARENFSFSVKPGEKVRLGQLLGQ